MTRLTAALAAVLLILAAAPAHANPSWDGEGDDDGVIVDGSDPGTPGGPGGGSGGTIPVPGPWVQRVYVPGCLGNAVQATGPRPSEYETIQDALCTEWTLCPVEGQHRWYVYERPMGADNRATGPFSHAGMQCRAQPDPSEAEPPAITVADIVDAAKAVAPQPTFAIEPAARTFVNIPTNFAADVQEQTIPVVVLGFTIPVEFTPAEVRWDFGDGQSATGVGVRGAAVGQADAVEHAYRRSGDRQVTVTVGYAARILVPGGDPIVIDTPIERAAAPQTLGVGEIQSVVTDVS